MFYYPPPPSPTQQSEEPNNSNTPATSDRDTNSGYHHQQQQYHPHYPNYHPHQDQEYSTSYPQFQDQEYHVNSTNTNTNSHLHHSPYCPPIVYHPPNPNQLGGLGTYAVSQSVSAEITPFAGSTTGNDNDASTAEGKLQQEQEGEEDGQLPNLLSLEDDRKPSARSCDLTLPSVHQHQEAYQDLEPIPLNRISTSIPASVADGQHGQQGYDSQVAYETPFAETPPQARTRFASTYVNDANIPSLPAHAQDTVPASASNNGSKLARESLPFSSSARALPHTNSSGTGAAGVGGEGGAWERMFRDLTEYKRANGHTDVPQKYCDNAALGNWVNKVR